MTTIRDEYPIDGSDRTTAHIDGTGGANASGITSPASGPDGLLTEITPENTDEAGYLSYLQAAEKSGKTLFNSNLSSRWERSLKAYRNQHFDGSKYNSEQFRARSKLFRPKTRVAVRKHLASTQKAMFGPGDVVAITAQDESSEQQRASAAIKQQILNYRLDRKSAGAGIRWMQTVMGARENSLVQGLCISKQSWRFVEEPEYDETGQPVMEDVFDYEDGEAPQKPKMVTIEDRPDVYLYPPENVLFSPNCDWRNPAQTSEFIILRHEMSKTEIIALITSGKNGAVKFRDIKESDLTKAMASKAGNNATDTASARAARNDGVDPQKTQSSVSPSTWIYENFVRIGKVDMVFWSIGARMIISDPIPVRVAYPWCRERPIVIGFGSVEAHRAIPMSPVESWQPVQQEINDEVNLRLDHMKQVVTPLAKVKRGRQVDIKAVQSRGGNNGVLMLQDIEDVEYVQIPDLPQSAYVENNYLNADFDDAAGTFNSGSVQTNRSLNETVGGMKLLAGDANTMGDFDLSIFVETWAEPVIGQLVKLIEYYESDPVILGIAGDRAELIEKFGISEITDTLLMQETQVNIKVGAGVANLPQERLQRMQMAATIVGGIAAPFIERGVNQLPSLKMKQLVDTVYGDAGIPDASERFFNNINDEPAPPQQGPSPEAQAEQAKLEMEKQRMGMEMQHEQEKLGMEKEKHQQKMQHDREMMQHKSAIAQQQGNLQMQQAEQKAAIDAQIGQQKVQQVQQQGAIQMHTAQQQAALDAHMGQQKLHQGEQSHSQKLQHGEQAAAAKFQAQKIANGEAAPKASPAPPPPPPSPAPAAPAQDMTQLVQALMALAQGVAKSNELLAQVVAQSPQQGSAPQQQGVGL